MAMVSTPALSRATLVPPVEMISQPSFLSSWANSTMPALSETEISVSFSHFSLPFKSSSATTVEIILSALALPYLRATPKLSKTSG